MTFLSTLISVRPDSKCKNNKLKRFKQFNNLFNNDFCGFARINFSRGHSRSFKFDRIILALTVFGKSSGSARNFQIQSN